MERLQEIEKTLDALHKDFNEQVVALSSDRREFHDSLIDLSTKYPEHKELIQFIVLVNDKLETNQHTFGEIIIESFNDLIKTKKVLVKEIIESKAGVHTRITELHHAPHEKFIDRMKKMTISDIKSILLYVTLIFISIGIMLDIGFISQIIAAIKGVF